MKESDKEESIINICYTLIIYPLFSVYASIGFWILLVDSGMDNLLSIGLSVYLGILAFITFNMEKRSVFYEKNKKIKKDI